MESILNDLTLIPHVTIHPDRICLYNEIKWHNGKKSSAIISNETDHKSEVSLNFIKSSRKNNGYLSSHAIRKLYKSIDYLLITSNKRKVYSKVQQKYITYRIVFITLTLPAQQIHSDKEITNKCLNQFFIELQRYHNVNKYVWRAEKQENGNIHYHILINEFIEYQDLRKRWNRICNKLGYVDSFQAKMKDFYKNGFRKSDNENDKRTIEQQRKAFIIGQKSDWRSPNSTDIHNCRQIRDLKAYVGKYMSKNPELNLMSSEEKIEKLQVKCRLWSSSQNLANVEGCQLIEDWEISDELDKVVSNSKCKVYRDKYFSVIFINATELVKYGSEILYNYFSNYLIDKFDYHLQRTIAC